MKVLEIHAQKSNFQMQLFDAMIRRLCTNNEILTSTSKLAFVNSREFSSALVAARRTRLLQQQQCSDTQQRE